MKSKSRLSFLIGIFFISIQLNAQNYDCLKGEWVCFRIENRFGNTGEKYTPDKKPYSTDSNIFFINHSELIYNDYPFKYSGKYIIRDSMILFSHIIFKIEKCDNSTLILLKYIEPIINNKYDYKFYFKRKVKTL
jgi:hypothetical protein